jgi:hypothetical protein
MTPSCKSERTRRTPRYGLVAEWLRRGLQILVRGFDSLRGLALFQAMNWRRHFKGAPKDNATEKGRAGARSALRSGFSTVAL